MIFVLSFQQKQDKSLNTLEEKDKDSFRSRNSGSDSGSDGGNSKSRSPSPSRRKVARRRSFFTGDWMKTGALPVWLVSAGQGLGVGVLSGGLVAGVQFLPGVREQEQKSVNRGREKYS